MEVSESSFGVLLLELVVESKEIWGDEPAIITTQFSLSWIGVLIRIM